MSPDGRQVVYTVTQGDRDKDRTVSQLWLADTDRTNHRQLTWLGDRHGSPRWSPDGEWLAFVSNRGEGSAIFVQPMNGPGEARELTRHKQGISGLAWSPDGRSLAYNTRVDPDDPDEERGEKTPTVRLAKRVDYKFDGVGFMGEVREQVFLVDVETGERRRLTNGPDEHTNPHWSADGGRLAASRMVYADLSGKVVLIDVASGEQRVAGDATYDVEHWRWSPGGDRIALLASLTPDGQNELLIVDVASDNVRQLTDGLVVSPTDNPFWLNDQEILIVGDHKGASGLYTANVETGGLEQVAGWQALRAAASSNATARYVAQTHTSMEAYGEIAVHDLQTGEDRLITTLNNELLASVAIPEVEYLEVERDGFSIGCWLLKPPGFDPSRRYPLILSIHGGPHGYFSPAMRFPQQVLAANGYLVVNTNPRGSGSYGRGVRDQVRNDWGGADYLDQMAVVDALLERPFVDPERLGVTGFSYGGFMTSWIIGQTSRFKAAVVGAPVFDLESFYGTSDISPSWSEIQYGGPPWERLDYYQAHSPSSFAQRATTPTLIVHGEADDRCPIGQGEQLFLILKRVGCETEFARYPGGGHGFLGFAGVPEQRCDCYQRYLDWFDRFLR